MNLTEYSIGEAAEQIAARELSPVELTRAYLERIAQHDATLNAYITLTAELAMQQAEAAEREISAGRYRGPLHGIPLALKDLYETKGIRTTAGSSFFSEHVPDANGATVNMLDQAGAILLGKLNMHEIALGVTNNNPHFGPCKNPWALDCITGGSSGGSGAAVAADLCAGSLGSDTGGSIRIPASLCGIVGLKPTTGRVSLRGIIPLSWNLDHAGPMTKCVRDAALILQGIAGYDRADAYSVDVAVDDYLANLSGGVRGLRIGLARGYFAEADPEVVRAVEKAALTMEEAGAHISEVDLDIAREAALANGITSSSDAAAFHSERLKQDSEKFGADVLTRLRLGSSYSSIDYALARRKQRLLQQSMNQYFAEYDLLLTPTTSSAAVVREGLDAVAAARTFTRFTSPFNLAGLPALSVPCGFTADGLPIGLQIVGGAWDEALVLRAGYAYEQATTWHKQKPTL